MATQDAAMPQAANMDMLQQYQQQLLLSGQAGYWPMMMHNPYFAGYQCMAPQLQGGQSGWGQLAGSSADKENRPNAAAALSLPGSGAHAKPQENQVSPAELALREQVAKAKRDQEQRELEQREQARRAQEEQATHDRQQREKEEREKAKLQEQANKIREQEIQAEQRAKSRDSLQGMPDPVRQAIERMVENRRKDPMRTSAQAKTEFFLTPADLAQLPCESLGGWGCGRMKLYHIDHLKRMAVRVHGEAGFQKKLEARQRREANKEAKEQAAKQKAEELKQAARAPGAPTAIAPSDAQSALSTKKWLKTAVRGKLGFDPRNDGPASFRIEVPNVSAGTYAILIGKSWDAKLATLVKSGAWYSEMVDRKHLFGDTDISKHSRGVHLVLDDILRLKYMPSQSLLCVHGCTDFRHDW